MRCKLRAGARKTQAPATFELRVKTIIKNDATISDHPNVEMAECSKSFLGATRRASGHCSEATPSLRDCSANRVAIRPIRIAGKHIQIDEEWFRKNATWWCGGGSRPIMAKPREVRALEAAMIQSNCFGVRFSNKGLMRGSLSLVS